MHPDGRSEELHCPACHSASVIGVFSSRTVLSTTIATRNTGQQRKHIFCAATAYTYSCRHHAPLPPCSDRAAQYRFRCAIAEAAQPTKTKSKNSGTVAPVGVGLPESLTMFKDDVEVDLAVTRHYTVPAEISSASPKAATNAPVLQLRQIITYATPTQRGRVPAASNPSGESAVKGPSRLEPKPPHQQHRHADVRSGGVMTATTQTQLSTAVTTSSQRQCQSTLQLQSGATPVLVAPSIPFPLTYLPHPPSQQSNWATPHTLHNTRASSGVQATNHRSGGGALPRPSDNSVTASGKGGQKKEPSATVRGSTFLNDTPLGAMPSDGASSLSQLHSLLK